MTISTQVAAISRWIWTWDAAPACSHVRVLLPVPATHCQFPAFGSVAPGVHLSITAG